MSYKIKLKVSPITMGVTGKTIENIEYLMNRLKLHNRSHLMKLLVNYFIKNKDKIKELINSGDE